MNVDDDANNGPLLRITLVLICTYVRNHLSKYFFICKIVLHECLIHDGGAHSISPVVRIEIAALNQRALHGLEISRRNTAVVGKRFISRRWRWSALDSEIRSDVSTAEWHRSNKCSALNSRQRTQA